MRKLFAEIKSHSLQEWDVSYTVVDHGRCWFVTSVLSYQPGKGNATKAMQHLLLYARLYKRRVELECCSRSRSPSGPYDHDCVKEMTERALGMYLRAGFNISYVRHPDRYPIYELYYDPR